MRRETVVHIGSLFFDEKKKFNNKSLFSFTLFHRDCTLPPLVLCLCHAFVRVVVFVIVPRVGCVYWKKAVFREMPPPLTTLTNLIT